MKLDDTMYYRDAHSGLRFFRVLKEQPKSKSIVVREVGTDKRGKNKVSPQRGRYDFIGASLHTLKVKDNGVAFKGHPLSMWDGKPMKEDVQLDENRSRGHVAGQPSKLPIPKEAAMAFADFDSAEDEGNRDVSKIFKKTARDWKSWIQEITGQKWKVEAGEVTLSLTSPRGVAIDVMWDYDPMTRKIDITVEGPKGKSKTFSRQNMSSLKHGKAAAQGYLAWMNDVMTESMSDVVAAVLEMESEEIMTKTEELVQDIQGILAESKGKGRERMTRGGVGASSEASYADGKMGPGNRKAKKVYNRSLRRGKRKDIEKQMEARPTFENAMAYIDALLDEGIEVIPFGSMDEGQSVNMTKRSRHPGMEKALNNLVAVAQNAKARGNVIEKWAYDSLSTGHLDITKLQMVSRKADLLKDAKSLGNAVARVVSFASIMIDESEELESDGLEEVRTVLTTKKGSSALIKKAAQMGAEAFKGGIAAAPYRDLAFMKFIGKRTSGEIGDSIPYLDAWVQAWHAANVSAPIGESDEMPYDGILPEKHIIDDPDEGGTVTASPSREHVARNFTYSNLKDELQMILRGYTISQG